MVAEASVVGVFRTLLILIGLFMVLRFFGRLATAKRNQDEVNALEEEKRKFKAEKERISKNLGKTKISDKSAGESNVEDVDFEEVK
ncbi:MAG: hypothetical protein NWQ27_02080 [Crocinitomicaceae bacterium]|uniref:hypothetical protein n=1 Tax=Flavobacterium sp. TaxID=239 RepID=UPI0027597146|nr:hypothetical protein [Crocinitomicaceae bacterium]MDP5098758.1 hypothetical protein [Crocinitomicaceae bacterium]